MAGFLFSLSGTDSLIDCINTGTYATLLSGSGPNGTWRAHHEGTFADYCSMQEGDNVYFFIKRKIYGIGTLININGACKYLNYPDADKPIIPIYREIHSDLILDKGELQSNKLRFLCIFKPYPYFFNDGIDMDEILSSAPEKFKILRAFWKRSFIKFSDEENQAFKDIILRRNIESMDGHPDNIISSTYETFHKRIEERTKDNDRYKLSVSPFLTSVIGKEGRITHEMAIEAALIYQLSINDKQTVAIFEEWDYVSHQVIASPFKPIEYMDKMDVFGYRFISDFKPTISNYLIVEIKKDIVETPDILQVMKYVDWVKNEYAYGDYKMINAFLLGHSYTQEALDLLKELSERKYIQGVRPSTPAEWHNLKLVTYRFNPDRNMLDFKIIADANE